MPAPPDAFVFPKYGNPYDIYDIDVSKFHFEFRERFRDDLLMVTVPGRVSDDDEIWKMSNKFKLGSPPSPLDPRAALPKPAPAATAPKPAPAATAPKPAPAATAPTPAPVAEAPTPAPVAEAPTPAPAATAPTPSPAAEAPKPAPVAEAPKPAPAAAGAAAAGAAPTFRVESKLPRNEIRGIYFDNDLETVFALRKYPALELIHCPAPEASVHFSPEQRRYAGESTLVKVTSFILDQIAKDTTNSYNSVLKVFLDSMTPSTDIKPFTEPSFAPLMIDRWVRGVLTERATQTLDAYAIFKFENVFSNCDKLLFLDDLPPTFGIIDITERMMTLSEDFYKNISVISLLDFFIGEDRVRQLKSMFENLKRNEIHAYILVSDQNAHRCKVIFEDMCEYLGVGRKNILYCSQIDKNGQLKIQLPYEIIMANFQCFARTDDGAAISFSDFAFQTSVLSSYAIPFDGRLLRSTRIAPAEVKTVSPTTNEVFRNAAGLIAGVEHAAESAEAERIEFERQKEEWARYYRSQPRITRRLVPPGYWHQMREADNATATAAATAATAATEAARRKAEAIEAVQTAAREAFNTSIQRGESIETAERAAADAARTAALPWTERVAVQMRRNAPLNDLNRSVWWEASTFPSVLKREAAARQPAAAAAPAAVSAVAGTAARQYSAGSSNDRLPVPKTELAAILQTRRRQEESHLMAQEKKRRNEEQQATLEASARAAGRVPNIITLATGEMINLSEL